MKNTRKLKNTQPQVALIGPSFFTVRNFNRKIGEKSVRCDIGSRISNFPPTFSFETVVVKDENRNIGKVVCT